MKAEGYSFEDKDKLKTALYYGLLCDTNMFSDIAAPEDTEMRDALSYDKGLITLFKNSNLSLRELEIAGRALLHIQ
jgi:phosphoesterase RecJ-like protein